MLVVVAVVVGLLGIAVISAVAAYRLPGSQAWQRAYNANGMGLTIELAYLFLTFLALAIISAIMSDAFRTLFLEGGWRSPAFLAAGGVIAAGVGVYMLALAPSILARKEQVPAARVGRECRLPYLLYAPFSLISWAGLVLPLLAVVFVSIQTDRAHLAEVKAGLAAQGALLVERAADGSSAAMTHRSLYDLDYQAAADAVQSMVGRYLWVVGVFMVFMIIILNTRITSVFTEEAQDSFKWLMWILLAVALAICLFGILRYQGMRGLALGTHERLAAIAAAKQQLVPLALAKKQLLELDNQGAVHFLRRTLEGGSLWLMFFSYAIQIVLAKVTHRSVVQVIFPRRIAAFLDAFVLAGERQKQ